MAHVKKRACFRVGDVLAILLVLALAASILLAFYARGRGNTVEIVIGTQTAETLSLSEDAVYPVTANGYSLTVCIESGEAFVVNADCPDKVCEHTGRICQKGASIVCAAAGVCVRIVGGGDRDVDFVAG